MKQLILPLVMLIAGYAAAARAQPAVELPSPDFQLDAPSLLTVGEVQGMWFPLSTARQMLNDVSRLERLERLVTLDEREITLLRENTSLLRQANELADQATERRQELLQAANRRAEQAESALDAWYRQPALWLFLGALVSGGILAVGVAVGG